MDCVNRIHSCKIVVKVSPKEALPIDLVGQLVGTLSVLFIEVLVDTVCITVEYIGVEAASCDPGRHGTAYASFGLSDA